MFSWPAAPPSCGGRGEGGGGGGRRRNRGLQGTTRVLAPFEGGQEEERLMKMEGMLREMWMRRMMRWMRTTARRWSSEWRKVRRVQMEVGWGRWD